MNAKKKKKMLWFVYVVSDVYVVSHLSMKSDICCGLCMCESCLCSESSVNEVRYMLWFVYVRVMFMW